MNNEELNSILKRGEEVLERSRAGRAALEEQEKRNQQASEDILKDIHNKSDDIHKDYLEHCQQQRQHLEDLHARKLAMMDVQIERAKAIPEVQPATTTLGKRLDIFRRECGWSKNALATRTGMDRKVQRHINDQAKPTPANLKLYADAFSKKLERRVSVAELTS
jgi:hypothetical protein